MGTMTAQQIYEVFHSGPGTGMWQAAQDAANRLGEDMPTLAADIKRLQGMMNAAWQGAAADVASQGAEPLALEYMNAADGLRTAQDLVGRQTGSFDTAARGVAPVPPEPTAVDVMNAAMGAPDIQQQVSDYLSASQHNVDVYTQYHGASQYNTTSLPMDYGHLAVDDTSITITEPAAPAGTSNAASPGSADRTAPRATPGAMVTEVNSTAGSRPTPSLSAPVATDTKSSVVSGPPAITQQPTTPSGFITPDPVGPGNLPGQPPDTVSIWEPDLAAGSSVPSVRGLDQPGAAAGTIEASPGWTARPPADGGVRPAEPYFMTGRGAGSGQVLAAELATSRAGVATPSVGTDPAIAPIPGTAGRRRDEDEECRISTYVEPDPNDLFGTGERAVRPVIGE
jgi:hypothetical protein